MNGERWTYQVVEIKGFFNKTRTQEKLNQLGAQGWELVQAVQTHFIFPVQLYLKKRM